MKDARRPRPQQDPDYVRRILWGALAGGIACPLLIRVSPSLECSPWVARNLLTTLVVTVLGGGIVMTARARPDYRVVKLVLLPPLFGLVAAIWSWIDRDPSTAGQEVLTAALRETLEGPGVDVASRLDHLPFLQPILSGVVVTTAAVTFVATLRLAGTATPAMRWLIYAAGLAALVAVRLAVPPLVLLVVPRGLDVLTIGSAPLLEILAWGLALDAGQTLGASEPAARYARPSVAIALAGVGIIAIAAWRWRPVTAEFHLVRGLLQLREDPPGASEHLRRAHELCPERPELAFAYASFALGGSALDALTRREFQAAIDTCREAMAIFPGDPDPHRITAIAHTARKEHQQAIHHYREAIRLARKRDPEVYRALHIRPDSVSSFVVGLIDGLAAEGSPASVREILTHLQSERPHVVRRAVGALGEGPFQEAREPLRRLLETTTDEELRGAIRFALERIEAEADSGEPGSGATEDTEDTAETEQP